MQDTQAKIKKFVNLGNVYNVKGGQHVATVQLLTETKRSSNTECGDKKWILLVHGSNRRPKIGKIRTGIFWYRENMKGL